MDILRTLIMGILIGMANVIPGVSGSTVAVVFNIYEKFVNAITFNLKKLWANRRFVIPLLLGMLSGVLIFSKLITILYENFPTQTNYLFTGLIIGSIPMLFGCMIKHDKETKFGAGKTIGVTVCVIAGLAVILLFSYLQGTTDVASDLSQDLPALSIKLSIKIFIAGILGAVAMIVPGISGSLLMLIIGVYPIVMKAIPSLFIPHDFVHALLLLLPNGIGVLLGLVAGAKLVSFLIKKCPNQTYAVIFGLLVGSAWNLFPGFKDFTNPAVIISSIISFAVGTALAYFSSKYSPEEK